MVGQKAYKTFNCFMLITLILVAVSLLVVIFFTKTSFFSKVDDYGCNNMAGFTWSNAKNQCIKVYENALQLDSTNNPNDLKAFIVFSDDNKSVDIFLPNRVYTFLQIKDNNSIWLDNSSSYMLYNLPEKLSLIYDDKEIYYINR